MDKKDITYIIAAFAIILVIAFVIKPMATGQPVNTGISFATPTPSDNGHSPRGICKYYKYYYYNHTCNPAYTGPDMEPEGPDRRLCQSRNISPLHQPVSASGYTDQCDPTGYQPYGICDNIRKIQRNYPDY